MGAPEVRRHFLPWDRPLPAQAAEHLASGWGGSGPIDVSRLLVVVPTRQSGRRLREALSELAVPLVKADGGEVYLVSVTSDDVHVHLTGTCAGCPGASMTRGSSRPA